MASSAYQLSTRGINGERVITTGSKIVDCGAEGCKCAKVSPAPEPPEVANGTMVLPAKS